MASKILSCRRSILKSWPFEEGSSSSFILWFRLRRFYVFVRRALIRAEKCRTVFVEIFKILAIEKQSSGVKAKTYLCTSQLYVWRRCVVGSRAHKMAKIIENVIILSKSNEYSLITRKLLTVKKSAKVQFRQFTLPLFWNWQTFKKLKLFFCISPFLEYKGELQCRNKLI